MLSRQFDSRRLIKIDNRWVANSSRKLFQWIPNLSTHPFSPTQSRALDEASGYFLPKIKELGGETRAYKAGFVDKGKTKILHKADMDTLANPSCVALNTDAHKAVKNDNYGSKPVIFEYAGESKPTRTLETNINSLRQVSDERLELTINQAVGAAFNGCNPDLMSKKSRDQVDEVSRLVRDFDARYGEIISPEEKKKIFTSWACESHQEWWDDQTK